MFNVRLAGDHMYGKWLFTWLSLVMSLMVSYFLLSFFPQDVFDEIWNCIESVPETFPTYSHIQWKSSFKSALLFPFLSVPCLQRISFRIIDYKYGCSMHCGRMTTNYCVRCKHLFLKRLLCSSNLFFITSKKITHKPSQMYHISPILLWWHTHLNSLSVLHILIRVVSGWKL